VKMVLGCYQARLALVTYLPTIAQTGLYLAKPRALA